MYDGFENTNKQHFPIEKDVAVETTESVPVGSGQCLQIKNKYILTPVKSGMMIIDQKRAHERILFETYYHAMAGSHSVAQEWLYPIDLQLNPTEYEVIIEHLEAINQAGFHIEGKENNTIVVKGYPAEINSNVKEIIEALLEDLLHGQSDLQNDVRETMAASLARASAVPYGKNLSDNEMQYLVDQLFACSNPNYTHDGKTVITIIAVEEMDNKFK